MAYSSSRMFRGPANTFPSLRCERLEERSVLSLVPIGLLLLHGMNTGDVEVAPCDSDRAASIVVEEGIAEAVAGGETIAPDDGGIAIDAGDESWDDSWVSDDGSWDDSWVSDDGNWDDTWYTDDYYDDTWYTDHENGDDSWVPDDEYWDDSWTADDTWNDWLPDDSGDVVILPAPDDGSWVRDWISWDWVAVPGSENVSDGSGIYYAMGTAGGIPVEDSISLPVPLAPETANLPAPATDAGSPQAVAPAVTPVAETIAPAAMAISLPPDLSAKKLNALPDVTMPSSESDSVVAPASPGAKNEPADESSTLSLAAPAEPSNDHLADPASPALADDLPVG